jgi:hypothetical protein
MLLLPLTIALGVLAGRLAGGSVRAVAAFRLRWMPLLVTALAVQLALGAVTDHAAVPLQLRAALVVGSDGLVGLVLARNLAARVRGEQVALGLTAAGWAANSLPIAALGGMPVSRRALLAAGMGRVDVARGHLGKHLAVAGAPGLPHGWLLLGDWIPVPWLQSVISPGDVLMALGIASVVLVAMLPGVRVARCQTPSDDFAARSNIR